MPALPRIQAYRSLAELSPLAAQLDALNLASRRPSPFDTFAYLQTFTAHDEFAVPGQEPLLLVARDGATLVGFLPLRKIPERLLGLGFTSIRFLMTHDNDRPRAVTRPEDEVRCCEAFYRYLVEAERGFALLELGEQDEASKLYCPPPALDLHRFYQRRFPNNPNATLALSYRSLDEYLHTFHKAHRKGVRRSAQRLFATGNVELVAARDPASLPALFDLYLDLERRSWKAKVGGHIGRHPRRIAFFRRLLEADQPMKMEIRLLRLDGVPIAGVVTGAFGADLYAFEEAFDEAYRDLAPGNTMMLLLIQEAIAGDYRTLNLLGNYAYYKAQWHATITETSAVQLYRKGSLIHLKALCGEAWRWLRPPLTQREASFNLEKRDSTEPGAAPSPAAPPPRLEERARADATLRAIEAASHPIARRALRALAEEIS